MPEKFNTHSAPFNLLTPAQQERLQAALDVAYFRAHDPLLESGQDAHYLQIVIKGAVEERDRHSDEILAHYANDDLFDVRALFEGHVRHRYLALEDTLCYQLPKALFLELYQENGAFAAYFDNNLAKRQALLEAAKQQQNLAEFILTKVDDSIYHPAQIIAPQMPLDEVTRNLKAHKIDAALVALDEADPRLKQHPHAHPYGIVTRTNMLHAVMLDGNPHDTPAGQIATFPVFHVDEGDFLFHALITMTRHRMKRVMVCRGQQAVGMLDMTQILSSFSTHSHVLTLSIARATSIDELALASNKQKQLVDSLLSNGIRTRFIMALISAVNELIIEKAFQLIVPPAMHDQCCFVVLGSEGRGEQILKTDQDNALILQDGLDWPQCQQVMENLTQTLRQLGYPLCPGQVMVNNVEWVKTQSQWQYTIDQWIESANPNSVMRMAIFADAQPIAGNRALLTPCSAHLRAMMKNRMLVLQEFVRPAVHFSLPLTLFGKLKNDKQGVDLKSGGIFPIVHGIRALALEYAVPQRNTFERIDALRELAILESDTADNLSEALKLFFRLRLVQQIEQQQTHNRIDLAKLEHTERDLLRHSLQVVKKFKEFLAYHYHIRD